MLARWFDWWVSELISGKLWMVIDGFGRAVVNTLDICDAKEMIYPC